MALRKAGDHSANPVPPRANVQKILEIHEAPSAMELARAIPT
jgi:hypothetical protein